MQPEQLEHKMLRVKKFVYWAGNQSSSRVMLSTMSPQVVRSALRLEKGREVVMFWYLESIEVPEKSHSLFGAPWQLRHLHSGHFHRHLQHCHHADSQRPSKVAGLDQQNLRAELSGMSRISADQKRIYRATRKDNAYLEVGLHLPFHQCHRDRLPGASLSAELIRKLFSNVIPPMHLGNNASVHCSTWGAPLPSGRLLPISTCLSEQSAAQR